MAVQFSVAVRNARADSCETAIGATAVLRLRTGAPPATCATADSGTIVATMTLPSDWMSAASAGAKALSGSWSDPAADNAGTVGHFRLYDSTGVTCGMQGTVTITAGGGDMTLDNNVVTLGQLVTIVTFGWTEPNA